MCELTLPLRLFVRAFNLLSHCGRVIRIRRNLCLTKRKAVLANQDTGCANAPCEWRERAERRGKIEYSGVERVRREDATWYQYGGKGGRQSKAEKGGNGRGVQ